MHFFQLGTHSAVTWRLFIFKFSQSLCYDSNFPPFPVTVHPTVSVSRVLLHRKQNHTKQPPRIGTSPLNSPINMLW